MLEQLANGLQLVRDLASQFAEKAGLIIQAITTDPSTFLQNLLSGLGDAVRQVFDNLTQTPFLQNKLYKWLVGGIPSLSSLGTLDFSSLDHVTDFLLQYSGLTWPHLQDVLKRQLGAGNYAAATQVATCSSGPISPRAASRRRCWTSCRTCRAGWRRSVRNTRRPWRGSAGLGWPRN